MTHEDHIKELKKLQDAPPPYMPIIKVGNREAEMSKLGNYTSFGPKRYLLFGGSPGTGKTSWLDHHLVLAPIYAISKSGGRKPYWLYRSMERPGFNKRTKWLAWLHFVETGEALSVATLLNWPDKQRTLTTADWYTFESYEWFFDFVDKQVDIVQGAASPEQIRDYAIGVAQQRGVYVTMSDDMVLCNGQAAGHFMPDVFAEKDGVKRHYIDLKFGRVWEGQDAYFPNDPDENVQMLTDHLDKLKRGSTGENPKDAHAGYSCDILRDTLGWGITDIQQFNRDNQETARVQKEALYIKEKDFRGSSVPYQNADIVGGIVDPVGARKTRYEDYEVANMISLEGNNRFRGLEIIKNSYGSAPIKMGYMFAGECGYFYELPPPEEISDPDYELISNLKFI